MSGDLVLKAVLTADGSALVGQVRLSRAELDRLGVGQDQITAGARSLTSATGASGAAMGAAARQARDLGTASTATATAQGRLTAGMAAQRGAATILSSALAEVASQSAAGNVAMMMLTGGAGRADGALQGVSASAGKSKAMLSLLGTFLGGAFGGLAGVAIGAVTTLAMELFRTEDAGKAASAGLDDFARSQSSLASFIDATTGKLIEQNKYLIENAAIMQRKLVLEAESKISANEAAAKALAESAVVKGREFVSERAGFRNVYDIDLAKAMQQAGGNHRVLTDRLKSLLPSRPDLQPLYEQVLGGFASSQQQVQARAKALGNIDFLTGKAVTAPGWTAKDGPSPSPRASASSTRGAGASGNTSDAAKAAREAARELRALEGFGASAAQEIANVADQFGRMPADVVRATRATADLDALIADLEARRPQGFAGMVAQAQALKPLIQESLARPIREMAADQERQIALGAAQLRGRQGEVEALQLTYSLMDAVGAKSEEELATAMAKRGVTEDEVRALYEKLGILRAQSGELARQEDQQRELLDLIGAAENGMVDALASLRKDGFAAFGDAFKNMLGGIEKLFASRLKDALFGNLFNDLRDQVTGADKVSKAGDKIANAVGKASTEIGKLGSAAASAAGQIDGSGDPGNITVTAAAKGNPFADGFKSIVDPLGKGLKNALGEIFGDRGVFSDSLAKTLGQATGGAAVGASIGTSITKALGLKGSTTGGTIGGAIGGAVGGDLGALVGSVLGSAVGGLFKKAKSGSAVVTGAGAGNISATGSNSGRAASASALAGSVQDALSQVATALGGSVGSFNVSIGTYKDNFRVSTSGSSKMGGYKGSAAQNEAQYGLYDFGDDQAAALAFAVMDAIGDGGIKGVSAAVQRALGSSPDLDEAIAEALKVREVEDILSGLGDSLASQLRTFEAQAQERVRIARQYGFDVLAIEEKNAAERQAILDDMLKSRVGSLQTLLDDLRYGDLFEGSAADQRTALLGEVAKAKGDADSGVDGAADRLADLSRRLIDLSREAFGTAGGEYAGDRAGTSATAEAVIAAENARIRAAQEATLATPAKLDTANQLAGETNDLLAQISAQIGGQATYIYHSGGGTRMVDVGRTVEL